MHLGLMPGLVRPPWCGRRSRQGNRESGGSTHACGSWRLPARLAVGRLLSTRGSLRASGAPLSLFAAGALEDLCGTRDVTHRAPSTALDCSQNTFLIKSKARKVTCLRFDHFKDVARALDKPQDCVLGAVAPQQPGSILAPGAGSAICPVFLTLLACRPSMIWAVSGAWADALHSIPRDWITYLAAPGGRGPRARPGHSVPPLPAFRCVSCARHGCGSDTSE